MDKEELIAANEDLEKRVVELGNLYVKEIKEMEAQELMLRRMLTNYLVLEISSLKHELSKKSDDNEPD